MAVIKLSNSRKVALVDDQDFYAVSLLRWHLMKIGYASNNQRVGKGHQRIYMHRFILNPAKWLEVDHLNGNRLDNRRSNLRVCTRRENARNTPRRRKRKGS
jgi:hypothetical protein